MSIQFSEKLQEKMEFTISQYIGELHEAGIIEKIKEYYEMYRFNLKYDVYIINALFDDTSPRYNKVMIFNKIANTLFLSVPSLNLKSKIVVPDVCNFPMRTIFLYIYYIYKKLY